MRTPKPDKADSELAHAIGQAVLKAARLYERKNGKATSSIVIRVNGTLPNEAKRRRATALNQYHFTVQVPAVHEERQAEQLLRSQANTKRRKRRVGAGNAAKPLS